jgi:hypothetical protein
MVDGKCKECGQDIVKGQNHVSDIPEKNLTAFKKVLNAGAFDGKMCKYCIDEEGFEALAMEPIYEFRGDLKND